MPILSSQEATIARYSFSKEEFTDALIQYLKANGYPDAALPDFGAGGELTTDKVQFIGYANGQSFVSKDYSDPVDEYVLKIYDNV